MNNNEDYQLEAMEDAAVKKSNTAKRVALAGAFVAGNVATGFAAAHAVSSNGDAPEESEGLSTEDVEDGAQKGADNIAYKEEEPKEQPQQQAPQHSSPATPRPTPQPPVEPEVTLENTTHIYDEDGNLQGTMQTGTVDGHAFTYYDKDGDGYADYLAIDKNGDGHYSENEIMNIKEEYVKLDGETREHHDYVVDKEGNYYEIEEHPQPGPQPGSNEYETNHYYDEDGNLILSTEKGEIEGHAYTAIDKDGDGYVDVLAVDKNNNGQVEEDEVYDVSSKNLALNQTSRNHHDYVLTHEGDVIEVHPDLAHETFDHHDKDGYDISDIHNDYDEKSGETYHGDLAENNPDYRNNEDVEQYESASQDMSDPAHDVAEDYDGEAIDYEATEAPDVAEEYGEIAENYEPDGEYASEDIATSDDYNEEDYNDEALLAENSGEDTDDSFDVEHYDDNVDIV